MVQVDRAWPWALVGILLFLSLFGVVSVISLGLQIRYKGREYSIALILDPAVDDCGSDRLEGLVARHGAERPGTGIESLMHLGLALLAV